MNPRKRQFYLPTRLGSCWPRCLVLQAALVARLLDAAATPTGTDASAPEDRLLGVEEATRRLGVSEDWLYRRAARLPFTVRLGRTLRFSSDGLDRYIRQRQGRGSRP